jgi:hypothetical protein
MSLKWERFSDESLKFKKSRRNCTAEYALSGLVFCYSLVLNVFDLNAEENFLLEPKGRREEACVGLSYGQFSLEWDLLAYSRKAKGHFCLWFLLLHSRLLAIQE